MRKTGTISIGYNVIFIELLITIIPFLTPKIQVFGTAISRLFVLITIFITLLFTFSRKIVVVKPLLFIVFYFSVVTGIMILHSDYNHIVFLVTDQVVMLYFG